MAHLHTRHGSIIVVVVVIMTFLAGTIITTLIATHNLQSLAQSRISYQQQCGLLEGVLRAGIAYCCDHRIDLFSSDTRERTATLTFDPWPCSQIAALIGNYRGRLTIRAQNKVATIQAHLSNNKMTRTGSCTLSPWDTTGKINKDSKLRISNWTIRA